MSSDLPNIVMFLLDDMGYWGMGAHGNADSITPHMDRLAARGLDFSNCYCVSPVCSPARASLLTGQIPSQHGVIDWIRGGSETRNEDLAIRYLEGIRGFSDALNDAGYYCGQIGKWHLGDSATPQNGFKHWTTMPKGSDSYYGARLYRDGQEETVEGYLTDALAAEAVEFVTTHAAQESPFFLSLNFSAPHRPWTRDQHPPETWSLYDGCAFSSCPDTPRHPWQINNGMYPGEDRNEIVQGYFTALTGADAAIGRVIAQLEALGIGDDTLIILTSDNGMSLGHHGIYGKGNATYPQNMYEEAVKVPFVLVHPNRIQPRVSDALISHYDFYPTLMDYLRLDHKPDENLPGRSFVHHIDGDADPGHESVVIYDEYGRVRMLRDRQWKFVWRQGDWPNELYDMQQDPGETQNLIESAEHQEVVSRLENALVDWFKTYVDPARDALEQPVFGRGQIARVGSDKQTDPAFAQDWFYQSSGKSDSGPNL